MYRKMTMIPALCELIKQLKVARISTIARMCWLGHQCKTIK